MKTPLPANLLPSPGGGVEGLFYVVDLVKYVVGLTCDSACAARTVCSFCACRALLFDLFWGENGVK